MSETPGFDRRCLELAQVFVDEEGLSAKAAEQLAYEIQNTIDVFLEHYREKDPHPLPMTWPTEPDDYGGY